MGNSGCTGHTLSDFSLFYVYAAALDNLIAWGDKGISAPHVPWIETNQYGSEVKRDSLGNALGSYRTSYVDVPIATYHSTWGSYVAIPNGPSDQEAFRCDKIGWMTPVPPVQLKKLYPTREDYLRKVNDSLKRLVAAHLLLSEDAKALADEAAAARVLYAMASDGLLPKKFFGTIHPRFRTPYKNTLLVGLLAAIVGSLTPIDDIWRMVNIWTLLATVQY